MNTEIQNQPGMQIYRCFIKNDAGQVLFIKRHSLSKYSPDLWEVPGGKTEEGEDPLQGLVREVLEETGLTIAIDGGVIYTENRIVPDGPRAGQHYTGYFTTGRLVSGEVVLSREHAGAMWLHPEEINSIEQHLTPGTRLALESLAAGS